MQVCSPQDIRQAHSQNPPNSRVSMEKPLSLTWLRTILRQLLTPLNYNVLQLYHKALRVTLLQGLLAEHTSGEGDRERDLIHLYNEVEEKVCFQTLQTNVVRERGICQTLTDGRCTRYAKTAQIVNMKAFFILHKFISSIGAGQFFRREGSKIPWNLSTDRSNKTQKHWVQDRS